MSDTQKSVSPRAWAEMSALALLWGGSFLAYRVALDEIGVFTIVLHRVLWAALALWVWVGWRGLRVPRDVRTWVGFAVMGILNNVLPFSLIAWGELHVASGLASIFNATTAIFGALVAAAVFADERLGPRKALGVGLGFLGVIVAIGPANLVQLDPRSLGQLAILAAAFSYALGGAWARARLSGLDPAVAAAGMLSASSLVLAPLAVAIDGPPTLALRPETLGAVLYLALAATTLAFLLYYRVLAMAGAANLMLVTLLIPPVAIFLGAVARHEPLDPRAWLGFAILALGLVVIDGRAFRRRGYSATTGGG